MSEDLEQPKNEGEDFVAPEKDGEEEETEVEEQDEEGALELIEALSQNRHKGEVYEHNGELFSYKHQDYHATQLYEVEEQSINFYREEAKKAVEDLSPEETKAILEQVLFYIGRLNDTTDGSHFSFSPKVAIEAFRKHTQNWLIKMYFYGFNWLTQLTPLGY